MDSASLRATSVVLVDLLRAHLGTGEQPDAGCLEKCDWARFELVARHHGLTPILYRALREQKADVPAATLQRMRLAYFGAALRNKLADTLLNEIGTTLVEQQISVIVLKGAALLHTVYDDPAQRPLSDIDLLLDERDIERAAERLKHIGLELTATVHAAQRGPLCHMHLVCRRPGPTAIPVELHWRLFEGYQPYFFDLAEVRARARQLPGMPGNVFAMSPEHQLAHLCVHLERHAVAFRSLISRDDWFELLLLPQGLGRLLWMYDIAKYLQQYGPAMDWTGFVGTARRWAIEGQLHAVFELCSRTLGVAPPHDVMRSLDHSGPGFAERIAHRLVLASYRANEALRHSPAAAGRGMVTSAAAHALRAAHTWTAVFPPSAYLRASYPAQRSVIGLWAAHVRNVIPGLWAESRDRLGYATSTRQQLRGPRRVP